MDSVGVEEGGMINAVSEPKPQGTLNREVKNFWPWGNPLIQFELACGPEKERVVLKVTVGNVILVPLILTLVYLLKDYIGPILEFLKRL